MDEKIREFRDWLVERMNRADKSYDNSYEMTFAGEAEAFEDVIRKLDETFE